MSQAPTRDSLFRRPVLVLLPVKRLAGSKARLAGVLSPDERAELVLAMLADVIEAVHAEQLIPSVLSPDPVALAFAEATGARPLRQAAVADSLNDALASALSSELEATDALVILPDTPLVAPSELRGLMSGDAVPVIALATDRAGRGTNALFLRPKNAIHPSFGHGSLARHREAAAEASVAAEVHRLPGLSLDIDTPADVRELVARPGDTQAQRLLRRLRVEERLVGC